MSRLVRRIESIPRRAEGHGGKARNLAVLARAGFPVPAGYVLSGDACKMFLEATLQPDERPQALLTAPRDSLTPERLEAIAERVRNAPLPGSIVTAVRDAFVTLRRSGARSLAVRSSSSHEDLAAASAAGLHATFLGIETEEALLDRIRRCWASLFEPRVISYLRSLADTAEPSIGVIIQAMVPAEVAGVLFTVNPLTGDAGEMVINASYGLGPPVVDGRVSPDTYRIDKASGFVRDRVLGEKRIRALMTADGMVEESVSDEMASRESLDEGLLSELITLGRRIESHFEDARDVEWAAAGGTVYVLQARPITALTPGSVSRRAARKRRVSPSDRARIVWSNINVGEALPGVATPLTWSILSAFSDVGFRRAFGALGCSVPKDAELVGNFRGRIYLNLTEFMTIAAQVPGLKPSTLLALGGGGEVARLEAMVDDVGHAGFLARLPITAARFVRENVAIGRRVDAFERSFSEERARVRGVDLRILTPHALSHTLADTERLLDAAGSIMLTCYGNLLAAVVALRTVLRVVAPSRIDTLERGLLSGLADLDSAAPALSLWHIAEMARLDPPARDLITTTPPSELRVEALPRGPTRRALDRFIEAHGYRGVREAELAEPRWREDATFLFATIRIHLARPAGDDTPLALEQRQRQLRMQAEADLERMLPGPARAAVRHLLALVHRFIRLRERLRAHVTEVLGMFRAIAVDASRRMAVREPEVGAGAAFFLTIDELHGLLEGSVREVAPLVRQRRMHYTRDSMLPDPPDTFVGFPPPAPAPAPSVDALSGLAASAGIAEGIARVLASPAQAGDFRAGEVLVAPYADVGWSPLFLAAAAIVTDLGGPLSHAAIIAREYGVPAVVNVKVGTRAIRTGDRVLVDGDAGIVRILAAAAPDAADSQAPRAASATEVAASKV